MPNVFNKGKYEIHRNLTALLSDTIKCILLTNSFAYSADLDYLSDIDLNRVPGTTDQILAGKTLVEDDANDRSYFDANDVLFPNVPVGATIGGAALYRDTGVAGTSPLLSFYGFPATLTDGSNMTVVWAAVASGAAIALDDA